MHIYTPLGSVRVTTSVDAKFDRCREGEIVGSSGWRVGEWFGGGGFGLLIVASYSVLCALGFFGSTEPHRTEPGCIGSTHRTASEDMSEDMDAAADEDPPDSLYNDPDWIWEHHIIDGMQ